jgi:diketogulonate reductase-like aldo/keto reductase
LSTTLDIGSTLALNNGVLMPRFGLGVYRAAPGDETRLAVLSALEHGYRLIDTAKYYHNEADVGRALRESGLPRDSVFITTKLANMDHGFDRTRRACNESLKKLGLDYLDLYLIHWPVEVVRGETWAALQDLLDEGVCRAIGVSNYTVRHLDELLEYADVVPAVNQVEFSPFLHQRGLLARCREAGIRLEAYSPLTKGARFDHPAVRGIAARHGKTPAQVLLRWGVQHDLVVIPKSSRPERIRENAAVFDYELDASDMAALDGLDEGLRTSWDPTDVP